MSKLEYSGGGAVSLGGRGVHLAAVASASASASISASDWSSWVPGEVAFVEEEAEVAHLGACRRPCALYLHPVIVSGVVELVVHVVATSGAAELQIRKFEDSF